MRDVDQEHWEQQIGAVNTERAAQNGPQIVAILAQGRGMSDFGNVPTFDYVQDVVSKVPELKGVTQYSIVLSAHSGGGSTQVAKKVAAGDAQTSARSKLPAPKPGQAAAQPADLVVMFDAEGIESVASWAVGQVAALNRRDPRRGDTGRGAGRTGRDSEVPRLLRPGWRLCDPLHGGEQPAGERVPGGAGGVDGESTRPTPRRSRCRTCSASSRWPAPTTST